MISNFSLAGGTTSSNVQEILAQSRAGLRTGLIHHPVWDWDVSRGISTAIERLIDGDAVRFIRSSERVTCDLLVIRGPKIGEHIMDDLPAIDAKRTVSIINQTPQYHYGPSGDGRGGYDLALSAENIARRFGDVEWYPVGPSVREALVKYHGSDLARVALAESDWSNIIDVGAWARVGRREPDGITRIGRHSRDHVGKWPESRELLAQIYPVGPEYEIRVLGGASVPKAVLGALPRNWKVSPFGALPVREFLHSLDVYVYFISSNYVEAFGRAPLEALAVGLPVIVPRSFEMLFGDAACYAEPSQVRREIDRVLGDDEHLAVRLERGRALVAERYSYATHLERLRAHGAGSR